MLTDTLPISDTPPRAVFVDELGRRARWAGWAGRAITGLSVLYLATMVATMVGAPWVPQLSITGLGPVLAPPRQPTTLALPPTATRIPGPVLGNAPVPSTGGAAKPAQLGGGSASGPPGTSSSAVKAGLQGGPNSAGTATTVAPAPGQGHGPANPGTPPTTAATGQSSTTTTAPGSGHGSVKGPPASLPGSSATAPGRIRH